MEASNPTISLGAAITLGTLALTMNYNLDLSGSLSPLDKFSVQAKFELGDSGRLARFQQAEALYLQGVEEFANGNYDKAIALWEQVLKLDPKYQPAADDIRTVQRTMILQEQSETVTPK
jgi:tetratricopeptide (TPR) repeat protein